MGDDNTNMPPTQPQPRPIISSMVFENFKSYAGRKVVGPFHRNFTAIVGPNGSGKSNVIDGLMFVFGRKAKKLRLSKVSELVHKSSEHPDLEFASVEVHFVDILPSVSKPDDPDAYDEVPDSRLIVRRTVKTSDSASSYYLNDKKVKFSIIAEELNKKGIDLNHNRFLILQGEVEQISLMKPKSESPHEVGLLEYLEDIIGTNSYVEPIEQASAKVDTLATARSAKLNRVQATEKEKDALEESKDEALECARTERALLCARGHRCFSERATAATELETSLALVTSTTAEMERERSSNAEGIAKKDALVAREAELGGEHEVHVKSSKSLKKVLDKHDKELIKATASHEAHLAKISKLEDKLVKLESAREGAASKASTLETVDLPDSLQEVTDLESRREQAETKLETFYASLSGATNEIRPALEAAQKVYAPLAERVSEAKAASDVALAELDDARGGAASNTGLLETARVEVEAKTQRIVSNEALLAEVETESKTWTKRLKSLEKTLAECSSKESEISKRLMARRGMLETLQRAASATSNNGGKIEKALRSASDGFLGRLGDLGSIASKYDVAISSACGGSLNWMVTLTTEDATACVDMLKAKSLGRATFAILEKFNPPSTSGSFPLPRLFDLIEVEDPRVARAFYKITGDTLVASDLDEAVAKASDAKGSPKFRVVTLDGQLVETSGVMSGGGKSRRGGLMKLSGGKRSNVTAEDETESIDAVAQEVAELEAALSSRRAEASKASAEQANLKAQTETAAEALPKISRETERLRKEVEALTKDIEELERKIAEDASVDVTALEAAYEDAFKRAAKAEKAAAAAREKVDALQLRLSQVGGAELESLRADLKLENERLATAKRVAAKNDADARAARKAVASSEKKLVEARVDLEKSQAEASSKEEAVKRCEDAAADAKAALAESRAREKTSRESLAEARAELEAAKISLNEVEKALVTLQNALNEAEESASARRTAVAELSSEFERLAAAYGSLHVYEDEVCEDVEEGEAEDIAVEQEAEDVAVEDVVAAVEDLAVSPCAPFPALDPSARLQDLRASEKRLSKEWESLKLRVNMNAIAEYRSREIEYLARVDELEEATSLRDAARKECDELRQKRLMEFSKGFAIVSTKLKEMYRMITLGGDAELELVDSLDPFSEGIVFSVRPPKKSWKNISNLSGGEKTLSSLALVFALHHFRPTPLYVMDEIDAALDFKNVSIVANYVKERTKDAQFIIISLRNNMFELSDRLVGVYKTFNATKSVTLNPRLADENCRAAQNVEE